MRKLNLLLLTLLASNFSFSQTRAADSLRQAISTASGERKVALLLEVNQVNFAWKGKDMIDSTYYYAKAAYDLSDKIGFVKGKAFAAKRLSEWAHFWSKDCDLSLLYAKEAVKLAEGIKSDTLAAQVYWRYAEAVQCADKEKNFAEAITALKKTAAACKAAGDKQAEGQVFWEICGMLSGKGNYEDGFDYCQNALTLTKFAAANSTFVKGSGDEMWGHQLVELSLLNIANLYVAAGDFQTANDYMKQNKSYQSTHTPCCPFDDAEADLYIKMKQPDSALNILNKWPARTKEKFSYKNFMGQVLLLKKEYPPAIKLFNEILPEVKKENKFHSYSKLLIDFGSAHAGVENYKEALKYINEGVNEAEQYNIRPYQLEGYRMLAIIYRALNNYKLAYEYLQKYTNLKESILNTQFLWRLNNYKQAAIDAKKSAQLGLLQKDNLIKEQQLKEQLLLKNQSESRLSLLDKDNRIKDQQLLIKDQTLKEQTFINEKKESQLALSDKENKLKDEQLKQQSFVRNALLAGLFLVLILAVLIFRGLSLKRKNEKLDSEKKQTELQHKGIELEMQALRAQMNPHFVFNCLSSINKFILKNESREAADYLTRFSRLIRMVLTNSQLSMIPLSDEIEMLRLYLDMERLRFSNSFDYNIVFSNTIEPETIYIPPMILQPFCENAIWHGLMHKDGQGRLDVVMSMQNDQLICIITDNGIGRDKSAELKSKSGEKQKSFGLKITTERLALFNNEKTAHTFYDSEDVLDDEGNISGTEVTLHIKYKDDIHEPATLK
ncbi:MAG: hypothetical protein JWO92_2391 [Chitinophagaceae bacterium]|nr:hypothetical protein [Chitinophagaceae bacterium]